MQRLSLEEFAEQSQEFDRAVARSPGIDHFCSSSDWILPAASALMPARQPWILTADGHYLPFMRGEQEGGFRYLEPFEHMWGLACPLIGAGTERLIEGVSKFCEEPKSEWALMGLSGIAPESELCVAIVREFADRFRLGLGESISRHIVDLSSGVDAFLSRRSKAFRRSLFRTQRDARAAGISIEDASTQDPSSLYLRIQAVEQRGWKGREGVGITEGGMHDFYEQMIPRLHRRGALRVLFAKAQGRDVAYILGGLMQRDYRGLQFSFDDDYRKLGLGNLLQLEQITRLCEESMNSYDLGTPMEYKRRWADREHETITLFLMR